MNRTAYKNQFNADHYERINFSVPKGMKQVIKDLAADKGMSMNKYFLFLVNKVCLIICSLQKSPGKRF